MTAETQTTRFQAPKGTRDFYPADMAVRRYLESAWRTVSINHGFDEIEGPTFENADLYTVKSGEGILSELFSFSRAGGNAVYALRPEFTPTLARMVAARAAELPKPVKWFCIPNHFRAERPQRGRLREFVQWNVDIVGDETPRADAEIVAVAVGVLERLGLTPETVRIRVSHRHVVSRILMKVGIAEADLDRAFTLLDRRAKLPAETFREQAALLGFDDERLALFDEIKHAAIDVRFESWEPPMIRQAEVARDDFIELARFAREAREFGIGEWLDVDFDVVRGLAYYTGMVFEVHEATGKERAIAGGGRYDGLVELFDGPSLPAVGFAMGDVVIRLVLEDLGLLEAPEHYMPRPDAFLIDATDNEVRARHLITELRRSGLHVRHSYRATKNLKKLIGDAARSRARNAVIIGSGIENGLVIVKDLDAGDQTDVAVADLARVLRA